MRFDWLQPFLPPDFEGDLPGLWEAFAEESSDANPHGFVAFLFHEGVIKGAAARTALISGDVALTLGMPVAQGHEQLGIIGRGAMGEVVVARDSVLRRAVALKRHVGDEGKAQFLAEAQLTAQLDHPGIVPVYGFDGGGKLGYSMKLIAGGNLEDHVRETREALDRGETLDDAHDLQGRLALFLHVCDAMAYAHEHGVVHRDLKPENIMVGDFNEVLVADWGIAHLIGPDDPQPTPESIVAKSTRERSGRIVGTPVYMSPEQASGNAHALRPPSDQYSLGLILQELVTLKQACPAAEPKEAILAARAAERAPMGPSRQEQVPPELRAIVDRATSPWPGDRYPGVSELAADVRRFVQGEEVHAYPDTPVRAVWRRLQKRPVAVMGGILAVVLVAGTATTLSLFNALQTEQNAQEQQRVLADLVGRVTRHGQSIDRRLNAVERLVESLTEAVASRLRLPSAELPPTPYTPSMIGAPDGPADAHFSERYNQIVSLAHPVAVWPPDVEPASLLASRIRLGDLDEIFDALLLRSFGRAPHEIPPKDRPELFRDELHLMWAYLQLADGLMLSFPGNENWPDDYDGRARPWYQQTIGSLGPRFGELLPDATGSGYLLPCNQAFYGDEGELLGVTGLDLSMDEVIATMEVPDLGAAHVAMLLDEEGRVLLTSLEKGAASAVSMQGQRTKERHPVGVPELEHAVRAGTGSGFVRHGEDLYLYSALNAVPWTLVVQVDADTARIN
ncbi:MAG: protein kinase [Deltaproteobacteria bacterium]|nr:protein kinase [Deltaproteobacteria bacterium]